MALRVAGSNPVTHPKLFEMLERGSGCFFAYWDVAKAVRHQTLTLAFRRFESCHPSQKKKSRADGLQALKSADYTTIH